MKTPERWENRGSSEDAWMATLRGACSHCGRLVPTETIVGSRSYEYDDWEIAGECSLCGEVDVVIFDSARRTA